MSEVAIKKYVVRLSKDERSTLEDLISKGKHPAATILKARVVLKADVSEAGEGWSDSRIVKALDTSLATVARVRQRLVEEGFEAVLTRKHSPNSARKRVFDGAAEAKLIALACTEPPKGRPRWTLALLEDKVVELKIVERASDNTIGRVLKKHSQTASERAMGHPAGRQRRLCRRYGRRAGRVPSSPRPGLPVGLPGRDLETVDQGNARADPGEAWAPGADWL
jgi:Homeodomain-like domain